MRKLPLILLAASVIANLVLFARFASRSEGNTLPSTAERVASSENRAPDSVATDTGLTGEDEVALHRARQLLATDNLQTLVARLRAAGFSRGDIRGIVSVRLAERYGSARVAATAHLEVVPYWRSSMTFPHNPEAGAEVRRLFREQNRMLKELLGPDARADDEWSHMLHERQYSYLPADKVERLTEILDDYRDLQQSVWDSTRGIAASAGQQKLALIAQEQRADIESLLTPQELEAYDMRSSPVANKLKQMLAAFRPSESEYQAIYRLVANGNPVRINQQFIATQPVSNDPVDVTDQIAALLTPERAAEFRMTTSNEYLQLARLAQRFELPESAVKGTYTLYQSALQRASTIVANQSLTSDERAGQLTAWGQEVAAQVQALLGQEAYQAYLRYGGHWITSIPQNPSTITPNRSGGAVPIIRLP